MTYVIGEETDDCPHSFLFSSLLSKRAGCHALTYAENTGRKNMLRQVGSDQTQKRIDAASSLTDALAKADSCCEDCKTPSPMVCVERCDVWRVKHEILEIKRVVGEDTHARRLLNVLKNRRRLKILDALSERSHNVKELQMRLREGGFHHSRRTLVEAYLKPMIGVGLIREDGSRFRTTFYGRKVQHLLGENNSLGLLPIHSGAFLKK